MNHEYTDAAVEQRESHEDESQDWDPVSYTHLTLPTTTSV